MFTIKLADHFFRVDPQFDFVCAYCKDYLVPEEPVSAPIIRIDAEERKRENQDGGHWPEAYLESLAVYRKICEHLVKENLILFHCSALALDGEAVLFTGPSGAGKSTHARLWRERFGNQLVTINDDKPLLSFSESEVRVWGTPYGGKDSLQTNTSAPVKAIVVMKQAKENSIRLLPPREALPLLLNQTYHPSQAEDTLRTLDLVHRLCQMPVYELSCTISQEAVTLCHETLFHSHERKKL